MMANGAYWAINDGLPLREVMALVPAGLANEEITEKHRARTDLAVRGVPRTGKFEMGKVVSDNVSLDGVIHDPAGDEGFPRGGWVDWWDDANHFVNWAVLNRRRVAGPSLSAARLARPIRFAVGFGAFAAIAWEVAQYVTFTRDSPELATAYTDTLGDLPLGTLWGDHRGWAGRLAGAGTVGTPQPDCAL